MIKPRLRSLRRTALFSSIGTSTAFLLINLHAGLTGDFRPTILSNAVTVVFAASWLAYAFVCVALQLAVRIDRLSFEREAEAVAQRQPERLRLITAPEPSPRRRFRMPVPAATGLLLGAVTLVVALGLLAPQQSSGSSGPVAQPAQPATASTITVTVTAQAPAADTGRRASTSPGRSAPAVASTTAATTSVAPTVAASSSTTRTKRTTTTPASTTSATSSTTSTSTDQNGAAAPQSLSN